MMKMKLFTIIFAGLWIGLATADDYATSFMLMNNENLRQSQTIWGRMRAGFKLDHEQTRLVKYYEKFYTRNPNTFNHLMTNASPYIYYLLTQTERYGMPSEIALIPAIESSFNPLVTNGSGDAYAGMWQFTPTTGGRFRLAQNSQLDDRRNIIKSSQSALVYLIYLDALFKQWDVAIGAYNWGEGNMYRAILGSGQTIGNVDYSKLPLRKITADYEPKIIALANIIENPGKFGVTLINIPNQPYFAITNPEDGTSVASLNSKADVSSSDFTQLNPQFKTNSYSLTSQDQILLPLQNQNIYYASINHSDKVIPDSIDLVADNAALTNQDIEAIDQVNNEPDNTHMANNVVDDKNNIVNTTNTTYIAASAEKTPEQTQVTSSPNPEDKTSINELIADISQPQAINSKSATADRKHKADYRVSSGDTLYSISHKFNVDINTLRRSNNIIGNDIIIGQVLKIKG